MPEAVRGGYKEGWGGGGKGRAERVSLRGADTKAAGLT